jgi:hypothetical protein
MLVPLRKLGYGMCDKDHRRFDKNFLPKAVKALTVFFDKLSRGVHKLDLAVVQSRKGTQIIVSAFIRERVNAPIAIVEVRKQDISAYMVLPDFF